MKHIFDSLLTPLARVRTHRLLLLLGAGVLLLVLPVLMYRGVLPLEPVNFFFFAFVTLLASLYRPGWVFLLLIALLPLEIVNLAPAFFGGIEIRPYQFVMILLMVSLLIRLVLRNMPFRLMEPRWFDAFWPLVAVGGFLGIAMAPDTILSAKQAVIVTSFVGIYFLGRIFFRTMYDLRQALPFFLLSSAVVAGYALWQNIRFAEGLESYQVMTGRPNALFPEADWLGMFLLLPLGIGLYLLTLLVWRGRAIGSSMKRALLYGGLLSFLILILTTLILTMARSAWLGAAVLVLSFGLFFLLRLKSETGRFFDHAFWLFSALLVGVLVVSVGIVESTRLSPFHLLNRIESTGGLQKITVACESVATPPAAIGTTDELAAYGCRHINLEDIEREREAGYLVTEIDRRDPNIALRGQIYVTVSEVVQSHPFLGIGWGSISSILGTDERGAGLNASNIFLEVWLGSGLLGLAALVVLLSYFSLRLLEGVMGASMTEEAMLAASLLSILLGLTVFNLFNSGILLGFYFMFFAVAALLVERAVSSHSQL